MIVSNNILAKNTDKSNIFTSKADVLEHLTSKIKKSKIEKIFTFTVKKWNLDQEKILKEIQRQFTKTIVVRSSALDEDSIFKSGAGNYESILFVNPTSKKEVVNAIKLVIDSYKFKGNENGKNQIFVQKQTLNSIINGVIFTRTPEIGSPYYVINYNENKNTESVTKGENSNVVKIFKNIKLNKIEKKWRKLIQAIQELESILKNNYLDIEFGITKNEIVIFQVRPITIINSITSKKDEKNIEKLILKNKRKFKKIIKSSSYPTNDSYFSDMTDWNPAEIIGNSPNLLDYSLYDYLIMKDAWHKGRSLIGYQDMKKHPLMVKFGNKPYVDIRGSFNSLIPDNIKKKYKTKLMNYYLKKLSSSVHLHDKVEFEILFTCFDFQIKNKLKELLEHGFKTNEIKEIEKNLIDFTDNAINEFPELKKKCQTSLKKMEVGRKNVRHMLDIKTEYQQQIKLIKKLLDDCKNFGTIYFSAMARMAFIASVLLKSLEKNGNISSEFVKKFMNSIQTPLSEFQNDLEQLELQKMSKKIFLDKYGHLRPGTYDITALPYKKQFSLLINIEKSENISTKKNIKNFDQEINLSPLKIKKNVFLNFIKDALVEREKLKFEFTKNLSETLELIAKLGKTIGYEREEIANLDIKVILSGVKKSKRDIKKEWKNEIEIEIERKAINKKLVLPSIIFSENDFDVIKYHISKPNFITTKEISSNIIKLNENKIPNIAGKIILIENADPGYDWIFTKSPKGLITKYGGVASHMAIRCAEMNLPAAIGCGEILFEQLLNSKKILLDCKNEQVISLKDDKTNELMEVKKTLKTLGYIK